MERGNVVDFGRLEGQYKDDNRNIGVIHFSKHGQIRTERAIPYKSSLFSLDFLL